jgi:hypothetical protein
MKPPKPDRSSWAIDWTKYKPPVHLPPLTDDCPMPISKNHAGKPMKTVPLSFFQWMESDMIKYPNSPRSEQWKRVFSYYQKKQNNV